MSVVWAVAVLVVALVGVRHLQVRLRPLPPAAYCGPCPRISVIVPARDEESSLPVLLASLQRLDPAPMEVVVVDDGSVDATARLAREAGATVVSLDGPPRGWTGKAWACRRGAAAATGDLLLFLDADTDLAPHALASLLASYDGGLLSVQPYHRARGWHEQLSSYFNVVSVLASGVFSRHPERRPMAFGPCLLTSREDYRRAGGHATVRADVLDDVALARAYQRVGLPVRCLAGGPTLRMRSYPQGLRQLVSGWSKNVASGATAAAPGPALATTAWVCAHHAIAVGALSWGVDTARGDTGGPLLLEAVFWVASWLAAALPLRAVLRRLGSFSWWTWALFPLTLAAFDAVFARSVVLTLLKRSVRWRGRVVAVPRGGLRVEDR